MRIPTQATLPPNPYARVLRAAAAAERPDAAPVPPAPSRPSPTDGVWAGMLAKVKTYLPFRRIDPAPLPTPVPTSPPPPAPTIAPPAPAAPVPKQPSAAPSPVDAQPTVAAPILDPAERHRRLTASRVVFESTPEGGAGFRRVERDVIDAFMPLASDELAQRTQRARFQVGANQAVEQAALAGWPEADRARYRRIADLVSALPLARLSLQTLLLDGRLPGERRSTDGTGLLAALDRLESAPLQPAMDRDREGKRLDRAYLLGGLIQEIAFPSCISQNAKRTCTVTTAQILMAKHHPAEYVRLVTGLASPSGEARLANGDTVARVAGTEHWGTCGRTASARLWQPAMMEYGNQSATYDNVADVSDPGGLRYSGLTNQQFGRVVEGLTGLESRAWYVANGSTAEDLVAQMKQALAGGLPVPTSLRWGVVGPSGEADGYHKVLVTAIDGDRVRYLNPWGKEESMSLASFQGRLEGANLVNPDWVFPRPMATSYAPSGRGGATPANCVVVVGTGRKSCV